MIAEYKDWLDHFPKPSDVGRQVTLMMPHKNDLGDNARFITGELYIDDWWFSGDG